RLAGLWQLESLRSQLVEMASAGTTSMLLRRAAFEGLARLGGPASREALDRLSAPSQPRERRMLAIVALTAIDTELAARRAAELLASDLGDTDPTELFTAFLQPKG